MESTRGEEVVPASFPGEMVVYIQLVQVDQASYVVDTNVRFDGYMLMQTALKVPVNCI